MAHLDERLGDGDEEGRDRAADDLGTEGKRWRVGPLPADAEPLAELLSAEELSATNLDAVHPR